MKALSLFKYLLPVSALTVAVLGLLGGGAWTLSLVGFAFVLIPFFETVLPPDPRNLSQVEEDLARKNPYYDWLLYAMVPLHFSLIAYVFWRAGNLELSPLELVGHALTAGLSCGVIGINVAHELGHRHTAHEKFMAKLLLLSSAYMHFIIEHNKGHHRNVSTDEDPASARYGETVYAFWLRSMVFSWLSAWKIEHARLRKHNKPLWNPVHNEMLRFQLLQLAWFAGIFQLLGPVALGVAAGAALSGALLLETVNYIEHYGLRRRELKPGVYERTLPIHSWNSNHVLGRLFLFELSRHSDHHYMPQRKYQVLRHFEEAPQMPFGYPAMMVIALVPPLWFGLMHPRIARLKAGHAQGVALA